MLSNCFKGCFAWLALFMSVMLSPLIGVAQQSNESPRVLVIFDTSGSMLWDYTGVGSCSGDGSVDYPHRNMCTDQEGSRLYHAKSALTEVINSA